MKRRSAPLTGNQVALEYLGRVSAVAQQMLPKGDRLLFVGRTRAAIEARVGPLAEADADTVSEALAMLGDPEELTQRERDRLYTARRHGAPVQSPALWKPKKDPQRDSQPLPRLPGGRIGRLAGRRPAETGEDAPEVTGSQITGPEITGPEITGPEIGGPQPAGAQPAGPATDGPRATGPQAKGPQAKGPQAKGPQAKGPQAKGPQAKGPQAKGPQATRRAPEPRAPRPGGPSPAEMASPDMTDFDSDGPTIPMSIVPGMITPAPDEPVQSLLRTPSLPARVGTVIRRHPLGAAAVATFVLGVIVCPLAFWPVGAFLVVVSRRWDTADKWMAVLCPPLFTLAGMLVFTATAGGKRNIVSAFIHVTAADAGTLLRLGYLLCACYLVWRMRRGPRVRQPPPWRRAG